MKYIKQILSLLIIGIFTMKSHSQNPLTVKNQLIIDSEGNGSGLIFTGINSSTSSSVVPNTLLTLDSQGNVIVGLLPLIPTGASIWSLNNTVASTNATSVIIGSRVTVPPNNPYSLYVSRGILTEKMRVSVANSSFWADYVFENKYKLPSLKKVERFIVKNKHLPDVPSSDEVAKDGIDFVEMQATLLKKIEELTLYAIRQDKEMSKMKKEIKLLKAGLKK